MTLVFLSENHKKKIALFVSFVMSFLLSLIVFYFIGYLSFKQKKYFASLSDNGKIFFAELNNTNTVKSTNNKIEKNLSDPDIKFSDSDFKINQGDKHKKKIQFKEKANPVFPFDELYEKMEFTKKVQKQTGLNNQVFEYNDLDEKVVVLKRVVPEFPFRARRRGISEGKVLLKFIVNKKGLPENIEVVSSTNPGIFEHSAVTALQKWRFRPGIVKDRHVKTILYLPVKYELEK